MADMMYRRASGRIEFLGVKNVGVGVKIVILCYSEAEIHDIWQFAAPYCKMAATTTTEVILNVALSEIIHHSSSKLPA